MKVKTIIIILAVVILMAGNVKSVAEDQWKKVIQESESVLAESSGDVETRFKLAVAYANLGNLEKTMDELEILQQQEGGQQTWEFINKYEHCYLVNQDDLMTLNYLAFAYYIGYQYSRSKVFFEKIIELNSEDIMAYNFLALVHGSLDEYDEAFKIIQQARNIKENQFSHLVLGMIYYKQGNMFKAMWHLGRAGKLAAGLMM